MDVAAAGGRLLVSPATYELLVSGFRRVSRPSLLFLEYTLTFTRPSFHFPSWLITYHV